MTVQYRNMFHHVADKWPGLLDSEVRLLSVLGGIADENAEAVQVSRRGIVDVGGVSFADIRHALAMLTDRGLLDVVKVPHQPTRYVLTPKALHVLTQPGEPWSLLDADQGDGIEVDVDGVPGAGGEPQHTVGLSFGSGLDLLHDLGRGVLLSEFNGHSVHFDSDGHRLFTLHRVGPDTLFVQAAEGIVVREAKS